MVVGDQMRDDIITFEDTYEILIRIENARRLIDMDIEGAKRVLDALQKDLRGVIYPNNPFEILDTLKRGE